VQEVLEAAGDLLDALEDVPDVLRRLLANEARFDVDAWVRRLRELVRSTVPEPVEQNDLFQP